MPKMDFYDLLKKASLNQKKAEKELVNNKRYNLKFAPMKKIERPKVNKAAIAAQLKKKEEEERKKAELEEQKRQAVLALRAEQEAAKSSKKRRDSSSVDSSHKKKENKSEEQKKLDRRAKREDWYESRQLEERNSGSSEEEAEEDFIQTSKGSKTEAEVKQKPKALSFKELMALAASNAKGEKAEEEMPASKNGECESKVKLKSHSIKGEVRDRGEKHKVNKVVSNKTSKTGEVQRSVERVKSSHKINSSTPKPSGSDQGRKSTLFPNTKGHSSGTTASRKGLPSQSQPSPKLDKVSKSLVSDSKRTPSSSHNDEMRKHDGDRRKMAGGNQMSNHQSKEKGGLSDPVKKTSVGANQVGKMSQKTHPPAKRNGGWLNPVEKAPVAKQVGKASQKSHRPPNRKGGWLDPVEKTSSMAKQVGQASEKSHHPPKRKGGWLDPVERTTPVAKQVGQASEKSHHPPKRKGGWLGPVEDAPEASQKSHHPPKRKGGWLDSVEDTPEPNQKSHHPPKRKGGWLDPVEDAPVANQKSHHPPKRKGGWLNPVEEPAISSGYIDKTSKNNSKHARESIEIKGGLAAGRNGSKVSKEGHLHPVQSTPPKNKVLHSQSKEKKSLAAPSSSALAKIKSPGQVKERKRGWLDPVGGEEPPLREERGGGGWLGPVKPRNHLGPQPAKRAGGWLGPSEEPSFAAKRGRLLSSEDEDEDSDMDGFIDDTPLEEEGADVSSYIKEIFGYDKSKYGYESDYALRSMEASYSQILKEEARSARIAMKEDAEELRKEMEREKMKKLAKAKKK